VEVPAAAAVLAWVAVPVAEPAAAIRVRTATVRELRAAALAVVSVTAPAAVQVVVLLRVAAPQARPGLDPAGVQPAALAVGPMVAQAFPAERELVLVGPALDPAGVQAVTLGLGPVAAQAFPGHREVVRVPALPAALREVRPADRAEGVVQRPAGLALQVMQAVARAMVGAGVAPVAGQAAARVVAPVAGVVVQGAAQPMAVPGLALLGNVV
jgi:hypothetical protein